jgi:hypothetical protein
MATGANSTPQTFRYRAEHTREQLRNSFDSEIWDDLANVIFSASYADFPGIAVGPATSIGTLTIPAPLPCRVQIIFRSTEVVPAGASGVQRCLLDGTEIPTTATQCGAAGALGPITMTYTATADLTMGVHILTFQVQSFTAAVDFNVNNVEVRRGRVPSV